jgi:NADPH-dependent 2,4-dienoyl-CoA reductase/sulfur reductase-like enzyme
MPGKKVVVLGSGDVGLIMARRMALEGAEVSGVLEIRPYLTGLLRNKVQCLDDFGIPLLLNTTITRIHGRERLEAVTTAEVDENGKVKKETEKLVLCDTLLTSVGLIPENELSLGAGIELDFATGGPVVDQYLQCSIPGVFSCGNVLLVNDIVDDVTKQGTLAGANAVKFIRGELEKEAVEAVFIAGRNIRSIGPQKVRLASTGSLEPIELFLRVKEPEVDVALQIKIGDVVIKRKKLDWVGPGEMVKDKLKFNDDQIRALNDKKSILIEVVSPDNQVNLDKSLNAL